MPHPSLRFREGGRKIKILNKLQDENDCPDVPHCHPYFHSHITLSSYKNLILSKFDSG